MGSSARTNPWENSRKIKIKVLNRKGMGVVCSGQLTRGESGPRKFYSETIRSHSKCFISLDFSICTCEMEKVKLLCFHYLQMMYLSLPICLLDCLHQFLYLKISSRTYPTVNLSDCSDTGDQIVLK